MSEPQKENVFNFVYVDEEELTQSYNSIQRERRKLREDKVWQAFCQDGLEAGLHDFQDDHCDLNVPNSALNADKLLEGIENINLNSESSLKPGEESENDTDEIDSPPSNEISKENISNIYEKTDENTTEDITKEDGVVTYPDHDDDEESLSNSEGDESSSSNCSSECSEDHQQSVSETSEYTDSSDCEIHQEIIVEIHAEDTEEDIQENNSLEDCSDDGDNKNINENVSKKSNLNRLYGEFPEVKECKSPHLTRSDTKTKTFIKNFADNENENPSNSESSEINVKNKYYAQAEKIAWTREKIVHILKSVLAYEENMRAVECSDDSDAGRLRKRAGEFAKRFARNYVYQPQRQLEDLKKSVKLTACGSRKPRIQIATVVELHQSLLKALQEYKRQVGRLGETGTDLACHNVLTLLSKADDVCRRVIETQHVPELQNAFKHDMQPLIDSILSLLGDTSSSSSASTRTLPRSHTSPGTKANVRSLTQTRVGYTKQQLTTTPLLKTSPVKRNGFSKPLAQPISKFSKVDLSMYTMNTPWPESPVKKTPKQNKPSPKNAKNDESKPKTVSKSKLNIPHTTHSKQIIPHASPKHQSDTKTSSQPHSSGYKQNISQSNQKLSKQQLHDRDNIPQSKSLNIPHAHTKQNALNSHSKPNIAKKQRSNDKVLPILLPNQSPGKTSRSSALADEGKTSTSRTDKFMKKFRSSAKVESDRSLKTMVSEIEIEEPEVEVNQELSPQLHPGVSQVYRWFKSSHVSAPTDDRDKQNGFEEKRSGSKNAQLIIVKERPNCRKLEINLNHEIQQTKNQNENSLTNISSIDTLNETALSPTNSQINEDSTQLHENKKEKCQRKLKITDSEWKRAHQYRQEYVKTLVDSPMYNAQLKKPWDFVGRMSDTMLDELLQKVVEEMQDDIVQAMCHAELK